MSLPGMLAFNQRLGAAFLAHKSKREEEHNSLRLRYYRLVIGDVIRVQFTLKVIALIEISPLDADNITAPLPELQPSKPKATRIAWEL